MTVVVPDFNSIQSVLDVCKVCDMWLNIIIIIVIIIIIKVCDSCVLLMSATRDPEEWGDTLLSSLLGEFSIVFFVFYSLLAPSR